MGSSSESGQTIALMAIFLVGILGMAALLLDAGSWYVQRRALQGAADSGALAGVRSLPDDAATADADARTYATAHDTQDRATVESVEIVDGTVRVRVVSDANIFLARLLGVDDGEIAADATAAALAPASAGRMLPLGLLRDAYALGTSYPIKTANTSFGNTGVIRPPVGPSCTDANGANDFRDVVRTADNGGLDACPVEVGDTIRTEPGNVAGPVRQGFDARLAGNTQSIDDVFAYDADLDRWTILDPDSPRIGISVVLEQPNGTAQWPTGTSDMRVVEYILVYIGKTDAPPNYPAYTNNGRTVWVTPIRAALPEDFDAEFGPASGTGDAPIRWALTE